MMCRWVLRWLLAIAVVLSPNTVHATTETVADARLAQPVTIECVNMRLHTAIEQLSEKTGVTIRCGRGSGDWAVRDIPVVVYVKDVSLGKLLQAIADSTHLILLSSNIDGVWKYRIWRDSGLEKRLAEYEEARKAAALGRAERDWDLWTQIDEVPDSEFQFTRFFRKEDLAAYKAIGSAIKDLGPDAKQKVLGGDSMSFSFREASESTHEKLYSAFKGVFEKMTAQFRAQGHDAKAPPTDENLDRSSLVVNFGRPLEPPGCISITAFIDGQGVIMYDDASHSINRCFPKGRLDKLPPKPEMPKPLGTEDLQRKYKPVIAWGKDISPIMELKVKFEAPKNKKNPTYADAIAGAAQASSYSIVATDFESYRMAFVMSLISELPRLFGSEVTLGKVLTHFNCDTSGLDWFLDEDSRLIVFRDKEWTERIKTMIPEKLMIDVAAKLNGPGIEMDDLAPLAPLTWEQCHEWLQSRDEWRPISRPAMILTEKHCAWQIYFALTPSDRARANTEQGASLAGYDRDWLSDLIRGNRDRLGNNMRGNGQKLPDGWKEKQEAFTDDDVLPTLMLRVKRSDPKEDPGKHYFLLEIEAQKADQKLLITEGNLGAFPIYSPEREAELKKNSPSK